MLHLRQFAPKIKHLRQIPLKIKHLRQFPSKIKHLRQYHTYVSVTFTSLLLCQFPPKINESPLTNDFGSIFPR